MKTGIFGLPFTGKTTVLEALSGLKVDAEKSKKGQSHRAVAKVPDERLDRLHGSYPTARKVPAVVEYVEIAGVEGKKTQGGMSDSLLGELRTVDALAHVVRAFPDDSVQHVRGKVDPMRDIRDVQSEMVFSDFSLAEKTLDKLERQLKSGKHTELAGRRDLLAKCKDALEREVPLRCLEFAQEEEELLRNYQFLTQKPLMIILNAGEGQETAGILEEARAFYREVPQTLVAALSGKLEKEISELSAQEQALFLQEMGLEEPALHRFIRSSFELLGLIVFFTIGDDEVRAWTLQSGSPALKAAGAIHSDLERGFIRAEIFSYGDWLAEGSEAALKKAGKVRLEGKEYVVQDGDIVFVRFHVKKT